MPSWELVRWRHDKEERKTMSEIIDNRAFRIRTMKEIIRHLHEGGEPGEVRGQLKELVRETDAAEIAAMEQQLIAEGMPVEQVQSMCDLHSSVLQEILTEPERPKVLHGHPIDTFQRENAALRETLQQFRTLVAQAAARPGEDSADEVLLGLREAANRLMDIDKHYRRKEHLLFSCLERHGITGPSKVMWGKDDEVRAWLKQLQDALRQATGSRCGALLGTLAPVAEPALRAVEEMIVKEEKILLPMAAGTLTEEEWGEIWQQSLEYGWCLVEPREGYAPPVPAPATITSYADWSSAMAGVAGERQTRIEAKSEPARTIPGARRSGRAAGVQRDSGGAGGSAAAGVGATFWE